MHRSKPLLGAGMALFCACLVAFLPVISNGRPAGFNALGFAFFLSFYQFVFSLPLFAKELLSGQRGLFARAVDPRERRRTLAMSLLTGVIFCIAIFLFVFGVEAAGTVTAAIALHTAPLFAILIEVIFLGRRKTRAELALTALLIGALYYLGTNGTWAMSGLNVWFFIILLVPLLWSIAHILIREELAKSPLTPAQVTFFRVGLSALFLGIIMVIVEPAALVQALFTPEWQLIAALMGFVYYSELVVWFYAIRHIDVSLASSIVATSPALTMVFASLLLHENVQLYQIVAFAVLVIAITGLTILGARKRFTAPPL